VLGPLKLATKYQADVMRNRIIAHLAGDCPTTLEDWDKVAYPDKTDVSDEASSESCFDHSDYLTKDFFPDPISFITLARKSDLPRTYATLLYSLCGRSAATRQERLSRMAKEDLETLLLGKDRMINFISGEAAVELEIETWIPQDDYRYHDSGLDCTNRKCHPPVFKAWSTLLQDVMCFGDPLATFRTTALQYRKYFDDNIDDPPDPDLDWDSRPRDEICLWCKRRMADKLDNLREVLFNELPSCFTLNKSSTQD
jgi:hypothetical protein